ncbi:MAG: hypothetical protein LIO70_01320 [Clostridiales bacterium]|nr:hypothetical protein [Clostridiales bacterium]
MTKAELEKLADRYQAKADRAYQNYQETGIQRYDRERANNEYLADAMQMAANACDEHTRLLSLQASMCDLAGKVQQGEDPQSVCSALMSYARMLGLIEKGA